MMNGTSEHTMRPVRPLPNLAEALLAGFDGDEPERAIVAAPAGLGAEDPVDLSPRDPVEPGLGKDAERREVECARAAVERLRSLVSDASTVAGDMRALMYLYLPAVMDVEASVEFTDASHLVIDCIRSMADRLSALESQAAAVYCELRA